MHETFYAATFVHNKKPYPCSHGEIMRNPPLIPGGFSPNTEVIITVRDELFGDGARPVKGQPCDLKAEDGTNYALQIVGVTTSPGETLQRFLCHDRYQAA